MNEDGHGAKSGVEAQLAAITAGPMSPWQFIAILLCLIIYIIDGLDIFAVAYAAPAMIKAWDLDPRTMGVIISAGSLGLAAGAALSGLLADRLGRRTVILIALLEVAVTMLAVGAAPSPGWLIGARFLAGVGIGALVPTLNVMMLEYASGRIGSLFMSIGHIGYAMGAMVASGIGALVIAPFGWRAMFVASGVMTAVILVLSLFFLPESLGFLLTRQPRNALERANRILKRIGRPLLDALPPQGEAAAKATVPLARLFAPTIAVSTLFLWGAMFAYYFHSYFLSAWTPQLLVLAGLSSKTAVSSGLLTGLCAACGAVGMGALAVRFGARGLTATAFILTGLCLLLFSLGKGSEPVLLLATVGAAALTSQAIYTGSVIVAARFYPPETRTTGVGFMISFGRIGGIVGPYVAGVLLAMNWSRLAYCSLFAVVCVIGAALVFIRPGQSQPAEG